MSVKIFITNNGDFEILVLLEVDRVSGLFAWFDVYGN
jgi:hypothetical protein